MAISFIEERKKQKKLIGILIIVVLITLIIWWQGFLKKSFPQVIERPVLEFKKIKINFQVLEKPILEELQPFEKIKPFKGTPGRENPFIPY